VKRSEAIGGIVKSISVIPDQILRSTYLSDFAQRIQMKEQTLIAEMNKYIRQGIEDKKKEREREGFMEESGNKSIPSPTIPAINVTTEPLTLHSPQEQATLVELQIMREIIRHGDEIIFNDIETDDGETISLTVAQYVDFDLSSDGIQFTHPIYKQILEEAVAKSGEEGFKAETYFCSHPDVQVSQLATSLAIDRHQLGGRFVMTPREDSLRQRVLQLVMTYRFDIVKSRLKDIQQELKSIGSNHERMLQLLQEHKDTKELCDALAKKLGRELIV
jgi:DNA primase